MAKTIHNAGQFLRHVIEGAGTPISTFHAHKYTYPHSSELEALRHDWTRVGDDMKKVIKKADVKAAA